MNINYKSCPLKKRPIFYFEEDDQSLQVKALALVKGSDESHSQEQPQDLSMKRKSSEDCKDHAVEAKRECALNLSKKSSTLLPSPKAGKTTSVKDLSATSIMLSPASELDSSMEYQPSAIHLRGLTAASNGYTTNPYRSAFLMAAGCNPMPLFWNNYPRNVSTTFPSPAPSNASAAVSPCTVYSYQHFTPPSSPGTEINAVPEDLTVRSDIPLPALYHMHDESPKHIYSKCSVQSQKSSISSLSPSDISTEADVTNNNYRFKCNKCNKLYSTSMGLTKHEQFHCAAIERNQEKKQHVCQDCGKIYTTIGALKMHIRTHTLPCKCRICGKAFSRPWLLQGHIRTHTGEKPFKCDDCHRSFADRSNLRAHQQTHVEVKKYACKVCNKSFSRMSLLNKHSSSYCTAQLM